MLSQGDQAVPLERQDQVRQDVSGKRRGEGAGRIAGFAVGDHCTSSSDGTAEEVATGIGVRKQATFGDREDRRLTSLLLCLFQRVGDHDILPGVGQRLRESLEQCGVAAGEKDHGLSLGTRKDSVKGRACFGRDFDHFVPRSESRDDLNRSPRHTERVSEEIHQRFVRGPLHRWRVDPHTQHSIPDTDELVSGRAGLDANAKPY